MPEIECRCHRTNYELALTNILYGENERVGAYIPAMKEAGSPVMSSALDSAEELGAMTVREFCDRYRIGHTLAYELIKRGELRAVKCGSRTLILARDARAWECSLRPLAPQ